MRVSAQMRNLDKQKRQLAAFRYKQIVNRHLHRQIFSSTIIFCLFIILLSCGPRSGIHNDKQTDEESNYTSPDTSSPAYKRELAFSENYDKGYRLFKQNCAVCHVGRSDQRLVGPGLKGMSDRLPKPTEEWFIKYTLNSDSVFKSGDKYAKKLKAEYTGYEKPIFSGNLTTEQVKLIYSYLLSSPRQRGCVIDS